MEKLIFVCVILICNINYCINYNIIMYPANKQQRANVFRDVIYQCTEGKYSDTYIGKSIKSIPVTSSEKRPVFKETIIEVNNEDVLLAAQRLHDEGEANIAVMNFASEFKPGGGAINGAMAQEEELFRRSNYFVSLKKYLYPIEPKHVIHTPNVTIIKDECYNDIKNPFTVSMIAAAAVRKPYLEKNGNYNSYEDFTTMRSTIEHVFISAINNKDNTLILGAFGCGVFRNPPHIVAHIFNQCIEKYRKFFKKIIFAVYSTRDNNYQIFNEIIIR
jgi:uncharacterized protein (TIGR02452 family)